MRLLAKLCLLATAATLPVAAIPALAIAGPPAGTPTTVNSAVGSPIASGATDAAAYWTLVYPGALLLSAILGFAMPVRAWLWGPIVVFAQVPVVIAVAGAGPLLLAGVLYAAVLSIPAALVSGVA